MGTVYHIFIELMIFGMKIGALFNEKIRKGIAGRRESSRIVAEKIRPSDHVIWMHAASLGEYEQGLPVLEKLKAAFPRHKILITFFSPSGYENVLKKNNPADAICYLPFDREKEILTFTALFKTDIFFTVKYDFWYQLLKILKKQGTKTYAVSCYFYRRQLYFKKTSKWFTRQLAENTDWFFHQTEASFEFAKGIGLAKGSVSGDTRYDRVKQHLRRNNVVNFLNEFGAGHTTVILGSSWEAEERLAELLTQQHPECKLIIAPHDLKRVKPLLDLFPHALLYSKIKHETTPAAAHVLIIDSIGILSKAYSYADLAIVGGGFHRAGLHNILEAAIFGIPVFFGNHYRKNPEADGLIAAKGGKAFSDEFYAAKYVGEVLKNKDIMQAMGRNAQDFILRQPSAAELICAHIIHENQPINNQL